MFCIGEWGDQKRWDENLSAIQMALNNSRHEATKRTPFFLNFGREMVLSGAEYRNFENTSENRQTLSDDQLRQRFSAVRAEIFQNLQKTHQRSRIQYDVKTKPLAFEVGEKVWRRFRPLSNAINQFSFKLAPKYVPCRIRKRIGQDTYDVQDSPEGPTMKYHANMIYTRIISTSLLSLSTVPSSTSLFSSESLNYHITTKLLNHRHFYFLYLFSAKCMTLHYCPKKNFWKRRTCDLDPYSPET